MQPGRRNIARGSADRVLVQGPHFADEQAEWSMKLAVLDLETG